LKIPIYQVDAFASEIFKGNPAAVCPLKEWLPDQVMQNIAMENNLPVNHLQLLNGNSLKIILILNI
tara:strand:- start:95 stop:292 length:198 start_codon:yes stop_codon:yes gene_type:complete